MSNPVPQGTVQLMVNGNPFGQPITLGADGTAQVAVTLFPVGSDTVTAVYTSSNGLNPSTSPPVVEVISAPDLNTATALSLSPNPANQGDTVTVNVAVTNAA